MDSSRTAESFENTLSPCSYCISFPPVASKHRFTHTHKQIPCTPTILFAKQAPASLSKVTTTSGTPPPSGAECAPYTQNTKEALELPTPTSRVKENNSLRSQIQKKDHNNRPAQPTSKFPTTHTQTHKHTNTTNKPNKQNKNNGLWQNLQRSTDTGFRNPMPPSSCTSYCSLHTSFVN